MHVRVLASVMGTEGLSEVDRHYLEFGDAFEHELVHQVEARTLDETMLIGWELLAKLPKSELHRLSDEQIARHIDVLGVS